MGLEKIGISLAKKTMGFMKTHNGQSYLQKQASIFHGINPTLIYPPTGKSFKLPRFCSVKMKQARQMNKIASRQSKMPVTSNFSKASIDDLKRLTSSAIEDTYSRVQWTNPKDGKVYNLLKQGEAEDGNILIRILDQDGAFIKETAIKPKKIAIIDTFGFKPKGDMFPEIIPSEYGGRPVDHGEIVRIFARRNNPFARYTYIDVTQGSTKSGALSKNLYEVANSSGQLNKKYDYLSVSLGREQDISIAKSLSEQIEKLQKCHQGNAEMNQFLRQTANNSRVLVAAGNGGKNSLTISLRGNIEGVGALSKKGRIADFSASRNSYFTQHYELGEYKTKPIYNSKGQIIGVNITGLPGSDFKVKYARKLNDSQVKEVSELRSKLNLLEEKEKACVFCSDEYWKINDEMKPLKKELDKLTKGTIDANIGTLHLTSVHYSYDGTSFSTPIRAAKLALNDMMEGVL